jgi:capsid protein
MLSGAYEATRPGARPFDGFTRFLTSPNSRATTRELKDLREFSRFLSMSGLGAAINCRLSDHVIGSGLVFRSSIDADKLKLTEDQKKKKQKEFTNLWKAFFQAENGHYERMYPGGYLQGVAFKSMLEGGDAFGIPVKKKPRKSHKFPFALQLLEAERIQTPRGLESDYMFHHGFQRNPNGTPVKIWMSKNRDKFGNADIGYFNPDSWESRDIFGSNTGIRQIFQLKNLAQERPGALRGIPFLTPSIGKIIDHEELTAAVLQSAKIQSIFAAFWRGGTSAPKFGGAPSNNQTDGTTSSFPRVDLTKGQIVDLAGTDAELVPFESKQPNGNFTDFDMHQVALIGAIQGIPKSVILLWMDRNYSANRGEVAMFWVTVLRNRVAFILQFLFPFWEYLLTWGIASGNVSAPGFFDDPEIKAAWLGDPVHQFSGPRMPSLDVEKEAKGMILMRDGRFNSTRGLIETSSELDPTSVFEEIKQEEEDGIIEKIAQMTQATIQENEQPQPEGADDA